MGPSARTTRSARARTGERRLAAGRCPHQGPHCPGIYRARAGGEREREREEGPAAVVAFCLLLRLLMPNGSRKVPGRFQSTEYYECGVHGARARGRVFRGRAIWRPLCDICTRHHHYETTLLLPHRCPPDRASVYYSLLTPQPPQPQPPPRNRHQTTYRPPRHASRVAAHRRHMH